MSTLTSHVCGNHDSVIIQTGGVPPTTVNISVDDKQVYVHTAHDEINWKIWERLNKSRELEITIQWQRSIFLSAFIILLLTGSGVFYYRFILVDSLSDFTIKHSVTSLLLGTLLMIAGVLWLAMTKGSKYWADLYEKKIDIIEIDLPIKQQYRYLEEFYVGDDGMTAADGSKYKKDGLLVESHPCNPLKPYHTSPSAVNCFIGVIIVLMGIFMLSMPCGIYYFKQQNVFSSWTNHTACISIIVFCSLIIICIGIYYVLRHKCKSPKASK